MATATDYEAQASEFIKAAGVTVSAVLIGSDCPRFCEDAAKNRDMDKVNTYPRKSHIHGRHYRCTFTRSNAPANAPFVVDLWNSYADEEYAALGSKAYQNGETLFKYASRKFPTSPFVTKKPTGPTPYDVLACLQKSDPGTFEDFCGEFGYDTDSRRAEETYRAVVDEWRRFSLFFTANEIERAQEIN